MKASFIAATTLMAATTLTSQAPPAAAAVTLRTVPSLVETAPVAASGDAADDPAIWVDKANPSRSLVIGNSKKGALESYDLAGNRVQRITTAPKFYGNVDVRGNVVAVAHKGIQLFSINPSTRMMATANEPSAAISTSGEGLCMYDPGAAGVPGGLYVFNVTRDKGQVRQYELRDTDSDGLLTGTLVRDFTVGTESEGCVADDATGSLFISEEDTAVWRYGAGPDAGNARTKVVSANATTMPADLEGLALAGSYLLVSAQNTAYPSQNFIAVISKQAPYTHIASVKIGDGSSSDDCDQTDGIAAYNGSLGSAFPNGLLVCQDGNNQGPGTSGNQNFKYADLSKVLST